MSNIGRTGCMLVALKYLLVVTLFCLSICCLRSFIRMLEYWYVVGCDLWYLDALGHLLALKNPGKLLLMRIQRF